MINSIQARDLVIRQNDIDVSTSISLDWKQGDILEGKIISSEENAAVIEVEGNRLQVKVSQKLGEAGDTLKLEIESISEGEIRLKPLEEEAVRPIRQYDRIKSILRKESIPISDQNIEIAQKMIENGITVEKETFEQVIQAKKQIDQLINTMTKEEAKELLESPYDVEKISLDVITRFLSKSAKTKQKVSDKEIEEELKKHIDHEEENIKKAVKALLENDLPVTKKNIDSLILVQEKIEAVKAMDDQAIAQFVKRGLPATLNNLYTSIFSSGKAESAAKPKSPYEDAGIYPEPMDYEFTREEIISLLKSQKIPAEDEYIEAAKILIKNHIEVDPERVQTIVTLKEQINKINDEEVLDQSTRLLKENKNPGTIELTEQIRSVENPLTYEEIHQIVQDIKEIDDETIKKVIRENIPINIKNLREEKAAQAEQKNEAKSEKDAVETSPSFITAKRQIEEIRLKMTLEAAIKLNQKIQIDTAPLQEVVEELKALEKEYYGDCLKKAGAEPSEENIEQMEALYKKLEVVKDLDERVLPKVIKKEINFIIDDLYKEQISGEIIELFKAEAAVSAYEEMQTRPEQRFGDTIRKVEGQIEDLLRAQEIEPTKENIRCARILIQNNIDVTEENILQLKLLDEKVTYVGANLHPAIAAEMIKEGFRPDQIPIDEVIEYINHFEELLGSDVRDKLSEFILELDQEKVLTEEEREGMIAIYRMLHTIEKTNGKVIGWLMKNNMNFTLNNLMEGAKYLARTGGKRQDMDVSIDDAFGVVKELNFPEKSIKAQLEKAFGEKEITKNQELLSSKVLEDLYKDQISEELSDSEEMALKGNNKENNQEIEIHSKDHANQEEPIKLALKEANLKPTRENILYAKILRQNNMEVTRDNITMLEKMAVQISSGQENPQLNFEEGIRTLQEIINDIKETEGLRKDLLGPELQEALNKFTGQIDQADSLTAQQRENIIKIYHALGNLEMSSQNQESINPKILKDLYREQILELISDQNDEPINNDPSINQEAGLTENEEESIRLALKEAGMESVRENMRYAKILNQNNIAVTNQNIQDLKAIDHEISIARQNLDLSAPSETMKTEYLERIIKDFAKLASPDQLKGWLSSHPDFLEEDIESIYREYVKEALNHKSFEPKSLEDSTPLTSSVKDEEVKEFLNTLESLKKVKQATLIFMEKNQIPMNIKNLQIVSSMFENPFEFGEHLEKFSHIIREARGEEDIHTIIREAINDMKDEKEVEEVLDEVKEKVQEIKEEFLHSSSEQKQNAWKTGNTIEKIMDIQKQIQKQEGFYQIPVVINNKITNMNIYVMKDRKHEKQSQKDGMSAFISMDTEHIGTIRMYIHMDEKNVDFKISGESKEITDYLRSHESLLRKSIEEIGYKVVKGQIQEDEPNENMEKNPLLIPLKKHLDSGFEIII